MSLRETVILNFLYLATVLAFNFIRKGTTIMILVSLQRF